ncbi:chitinase 1 [Hesseltinella vesiculosa]|uniref:chitinase n=1 Tax=Hesseltinella vesiculosa TaxID=101127 RepID=A0A1X2GW94_9FUNG|nr:chitinase 1 [Hesseltinella vesiculosa]
MFHQFLLGLSVLSSCVSLVQASYPKGPGLVHYWGQDSVGEFGGPDSQRPLAEYCDGSAHAIIISFVSEFNPDALPVLNLANACNKMFPGTNLLHCPEIGEGTSKKKKKKLIGPKMENGPVDPVFSSLDIKQCQSNGVKVLLSLGGATGAYGLSDDDEGARFARKLWDIFGNGRSKYRPFGDAVVDGFDLDIEGGPSAGYTSLVRTLRRLYASDKSKNYYVTAAPQCPYPDAILGSVIDEVAVDAVHVQFYNNYCSATSGSFNFDTWNKWATKSPNDKVAVYLTIPGGPDAAENGYIPPDSLRSIIKRISPLSNFAGIAVWDASQAYMNRDASPNYASFLSQTLNQVHRQLLLTLDGSSDQDTNSDSSKDLEMQQENTKDIQSDTSNSPTAPTNACVRDGDACKTNGAFTCLGAQYAVCDLGKFKIVACPASTQCMATMDNLSVYCDKHGKNDATRPSSDVSTITKGSSYQQQEPVDLSPVSCYFSVDRANSSMFSATVNVRRLDNQPFVDQVEGTFRVRSNVHITWVEHGQVQQAGEVVTLNLDNPQHVSMAMVFKMGGTLNQGVFVAPEADSVRFSK